MEFSRMSLSFSIFIVSLVVCFSQLQSAQVSYDGRAITIDGQRKVIVSGSIHYPRSTPEMWPSLIRKAKEGGLNAIETYTFWNAHEPLYRQYDFSGRLDLIKFLKTIQDEGLYAILRIGPYVCAEWNYGGFPVWLHNMPNIELRTDNYVFMNEMSNYTTLIVDMVKQAKLFASQGGPIILSQIENEYGNVISSYGDAGKAYINWCASFAESLDIGVPWIMCQESDAPDPIINTCNGWYCDQFTPRSPNYPKLWTENWTGWFKHWGGKKPHRTARDVAFAVARFFQYGGTLQNYYMYHGGTNFGRQAGGFITTTYDYDAPLDEYGHVNQPKWGHLKQLHDVLYSMETTLTQGVPQNIEYGNGLTVTVYDNNGTRACFFGNANDQDDIEMHFEGKRYTVPAWSVTVLPDCQTEVYNTAHVNAQTSVMVKTPSQELSKVQSVEWEWRPEHFEHLKSSSLKDLKGVTFAPVLLDQKVVTNDTSDYLWYMTSVYLDENDPVYGPQVTLSVNSSAQVLHAFFNDKHIGSTWGKSGIFEITAEVKRGLNTISLLSVTVGLPNYGAFFDEDPQGILGPVKLVAPNSFEKDLSSNTWAYKVGLDGEERQLFKDDSRTKRKWHSNLPVNRMFVWYKTTFQSPAGEDPVVLDLKGLGKGIAWVNGHNIGRYWPSYIAGDNGCSDTCDYRGSYSDSKCLTHCARATQKWYHVPRSYLRDGENTLVVFEEFGGNPNLVSVHTVSVGQICANAYEGNTLELSCHGNKKISGINFASFGNPNGTCGSYVKGSCDSDALSILQKVCVGKTSCSVDITEKNFGATSCSAAQPRTLAVEATC